MFHHNEQTPSFGFLTGSKLKTKPARQLASAALLIFSIFCASTCGAEAKTEASYVVIADSRANFGLPAPYLHRPNGPGYILTSYVFDTLVGQDKSGAVVPELADAWNISADGLVYDLTLNTKAKWQDGEDFTAKDVTFTIEYMKEHPYPFIELSSISNIEVISEDRIKITLGNPDAGFLDIVLTGMPILPAHIYSGEDDPWHFSDPSAMIGTGPFRFVSYDRAQGRYALRAVEDYYLGEVRFDNLIIVRMAPEAAVDALAKGEADIIPYIPFKLVEKAKRATLSVTMAASGHPDRLIFDHQGIFSDLRLRQALAYAIDRASLAKVAYQGGAEPAQPGYFQKSSPWFDNGNVEEYALDRKRAAILLEQAGWALGDKGVWSADGHVVVVRLLADSGSKNLATVLADQLESFGIGIELKLLERGALGDAIDKRAFDLAITQTSTIGDPSTLLERVFGKNWRSDRFPEDGELKAITEAQAETIEKAKRAELLHRFQQSYANKLPSLMLTNPIWASAFTERVSPKFFPDGVAVGIPSAIHKSVFIN